MPVSPFDSNNYSDELKKALQQISETIDSKSSLYFLLSGVDMTDLDKVARNDLEQTSTSNVHLESGSKFYRLEFDEVIKSN